MNGSPDFLQTVIDGIQDSIKIVDRERRLLFVNKASERATGKCLEALAGHQCFREFFGADKPCPHCVVERCFESGEPQRTEFDRRVGETERHFVLSVFPVAEGGSTSHVIEIVQDVTEEHSLRRRLAETERLAAVAHLAAGLAHEIRNPLGALVTAANLLRSDLAEADPEAVELLEIIRGESERLRNTLNAFLQFARPAEPRRAPTLLRESVQQVAAALRQDPAAEGVEIATDLDEVGELDLDSAQISQLVWNLGLNALQALGGSGRLTFRSRRESDGVVVEVSDTGPGVPAEVLPRIWDPFYTSRSGGTGLGLPIARRIALAHGGDLEVESAAEQGTTFRLRLPLETAAPPAA